MVKKIQYADYSYYALRVLLGVLFVFSGVKKLINLDDTMGFFSSLGFPIVSFLVWLVILSEIIFGLCVLIGWKTKYTVWPLIIILFVAVIQVGIIHVNPGLGINWTNLFFHLITIAGLFHVGYHDEK